MWGGWFFPAFLKKYPFFYKEFMFHMRALTFLQFAMFVISPVLLVLGAIDLVLGLEISKTLLGGFYTILKIPFLPPFVAVSLPFLINQTIRFVKRVQVILPIGLRKIIPMVDQTISLHSNDELWEKGPPILIKNSTDRPLAVSSLSFEAYSSNLPIFFLKSYCRDLKAQIHRGYTVKLSNLTLVQPKESKILSIPWGEVENMIKKMPGIIANRKQWHVFITVGDEFTGKEHRSPEIKIERLLGFMRYYTNLELWHAVEKRSRGTRTQPKR